MVTFYNINKGGIGVADELCSNYDITPNTKHWTIVVFYCTLNMWHKYFVVYKENNKSKIPGRDFLKQLGLELMQDHLQQRTKMFLPKKLGKIYSAAHGDVTVEKAGAISPRLTATIEKPKRCQLCATEKDRKPRYIAINLSDTCYVGHAVL